MALCILERMNTVKKNQTISIQRLLDKYEGNVNAAKDDLDYITSSDEEESLTPEELQSYTAMVKELDSTAKALNAALIKALNNGFDLSALADVAIEIGVSPAEITGLRH